MVDYLLLCCASPVDKGKKNKRIKSHKYLVIFHSKVKKTVAKVNLMMSFYLFKDSLHTCFKAYSILLRVSDIDEAEKIYIFTKLKS